MATTIVPRIVASAPIDVIAVDVTIDAPATVRTWTVTRNAGGQTVPLYISAGSSGAYTLVDPAAPLGVPVTYTLAITYLDYTALSVTSAPITLTGTTGCYLTNPAGTTLAVTLVSWPDRESEPRQAVLTVLNRPDPVGVTDVHSTPAGEWTFYTATDAATAALLALLKNTAVAMLRTQPDSSIAAVTALVGKVTEGRYSGKGGDQRRLVVAEIQEIAAIPATGLPLAATLQGLSTYDGDTLGELSMLRSTLQQLSQIPVG